jgi:hypothetical protein
LDVQGRKLGFLVVLTDSGLVFFSVRTAMAAVGLLINLSLMSVLGAEVRKGDLLSRLELRP